MTKSISPFQRKLNKFVRDPKGFAVDAVLKRLPNSDAFQHEHRPYVIFDGVGGSIPYSIDALLDQLAEHTPLLYTADETQFMFGVLEKHLVVLSQVFRRFALSHGLQLRLSSGKFNECIDAGLSESCMKTLRTATAFDLNLDSVQHRFATVRFCIYRRSGDCLRCDADVELQTIPPKQTASLWEGGSGRWWPASLLGADSVAERDEPVDIVYTWVNSADPAWQRLHNQHFGTEVDQDRFSSRDELRYSMRSVFQNCGWVRKIHVVTNCAPPTWLDTSHPQIEWVDHTSVLDPDVLPTFNCHAIETGLPKVAGLARQCVYFNDDVFVTAPLRKRFFFDPLGRTRAFLEPVGKLVPERSSSEEESWFSARLQAQKLLLQRYGYAATRIAHHAPHTFDVEVADRMFSDFSSEVERVRGQRVRAADDIPLLSFLYPHYALVKRAAVYAHVRSQTFNIGNFRRFVLNPNCSFLCINDGDGSAEAHEFTTAASALMANRFPYSAPWERSA